MLIHRLEPSPELLRMAQAQVAGAPVPVELLEASAEAMPLDDHLMAIAMHSQAAYARQIMGTVDHVYICLCNALTERRLRQMTTLSGARRPSEIYDACGCRAQCGQCVKAVLEMLRAIGHPTDQIGHPTDQSVLSAAP